VTKLRTGRTLAAAAVLMASLAGCGGSSGHTFVSDGQPTPGPVTTRPVNSFEIYLQASADGNPLFADVYGLTLNPLHVERLTSGKRISTMDADGEHVVVASADSDVGDRLGYVGDGGTVVDIPGLGRPEAFAPAFGRDNTLLFRDPIRNDATQVTGYRFFRFDEQTGRKTLLTKATGMSGPFPMADGQLGYITDAPHIRLLIKKGDRLVRTLSLPDTSADFFVGVGFAALTLESSASQFNDKPTDLVLLDLKTGKQRTIPGWHPICWNPDGTRLLVRRTADEGNSQLALLDPAHLKAPPAPVGTIPHLVIYHGSWVARHR